MRFPKWLALCAGAISATGFAPLGLWPVTLIAFALLMHLVSEADGWRAAAARGYWFGVGHFAVGLNWIAGAFQYQDRMPVWLGYFAVVALALYIAVYPAICAGLARRLKSESAAGFVLIFAALWVVTEWLRAVMFTGFAWNPLSVVLVPTNLDMFAERIGTYGLSGIVILISGAVALGVDWLIRAGRSQQTIRPKSGTAIGLAFLLVFGMPLFLVLFSSYSLTNTEANGPLIRIVQPNIGQQDKYKDGYEEVNLAKLAGLTGTPGTTPRLIFWPEAAVPDYLGEGDEEADLARRKLVSLIGPRDILLTGAVKLERRERRIGDYIERRVIGARNSLFALTPDTRIAARYDKSHLVPYGEYLPMSSVLSAFGLSRLVPGTVDFWPGPGAQSYDLPGFGKMGVQICYEIIFSGDVIDENNRPDFLFNPSNDAWFGSWGPPQHLAQAQLRAIEEGIPVVRSTPTGISAVIDAHGNILHRLPYQKAGFIQAQLPPATDPTLFARYGVKLSLAFALLLGALGIALSRFRR